MVFFDLESGKRYRSGATNLRNVLWESYSMPGGWSAMGIWPQNSGGKDILAVDHNKEHKLLAVGDASGLLKVFRYPSPSKGAAYTKYIAHSGPISGVVFTEKSQKIITIGESDKAVM